VEAAVSREHGRSNQEEVVVRDNVVIANLPFSPYDGGPPLGPAVLKGHLERAGVLVRTVDLNIRYLDRFAGGGAEGPRLGDQAKDRRRNRAARRHFRESLGLDAAPPSLLPDSLDPVLSLAHDFEAVERAVARMAASAFWRAFFEEHVFSASRAPAVLGLSIMGPAQVLPALTLARMARRRWPGARIVGGGSHVTLLSSAIASDGRYAGDFDGFLRGHAEDDLLRFVEGRGGLLRAGSGDEGPSTALPPRFWAPPKFEAGELALYDPARLCLPLQLSRGCDYGRCGFCTYPAVEESAHGGPSLAADWLRRLAPLNVRRFSLKDSLATLPSMRGFGEAAQARLPGAEWSATTKVTLGLARALPGLRDLGCRTLELGVETIHPRLQRVIDKPQARATVEAVVRAAADAGVDVVLNLIYGLPGETLDEAREQLAWFRDLARLGHVHGSHNLAEVNRRAPFAERPEEFGIRLGPIGPWSFSHVWNAPPWRAEFACELPGAEDEDDEGEVAA
jgi:hypothetical protein